MTAVAFVVASCAPSTSHTQDIDPSLGVDDSVDYEGLTEIGPWDDRNYQLTAEDLKVLANNESELKDPIPAFFRVMLRRSTPRLQSSGPAQYPRSALQTFFQVCGGYLIDGKYYRSVTVEDGHFKVLTDSGNAALKAPDVKEECQLK